MHSLFVAPHSGRHKNCSQENFNYNRSCYTFTIVNIDIVIVLCSLFTQQIKIACDDIEFGGYNSQKYSNLS